MALVKLPAVSFSLTGSVGDVISYRQHSGRTVGEMKPFPPPSASESQIAQRSSFGFWRKLFPTIPYNPLDLSAWEARRRYFNLRHFIFSEWVHTHMVGAPPGSPYLLIRGMDFSHSTSYDNTVYDPSNPFVVSIVADLWDLCTGPGDVSFNIGMSPGCKFLSFDYRVGVVPTWSFAQIAFPGFFSPSRSLYFWCSPVEPSNINFHSGFYYLKDIPLIPTP